MSVGLAESSLQFVDEDPNRGESKPIDREPIAAVKSVWADRLYARNASVPLGSP